MHLGVGAGKAGKRDLPLGWTCGLRDETEPAAVEARRGQTVVKPARRDPGVADIRGRRLWRCGDHAECGGREQGNSPDQPAW